MLAVFNAEASPVCFSNKLNIIVLHGSEIPNQSIKASRRDCGTGYMWGSVDYDTILSVSLLIKKIPISKLTHIKFLHILDLPIVALAL